MFLNGIKPNPIISKVSLNHVKIVRKQVLKDHQKLLKKLRFFFIHLFLFDHS